MSQVGLTRDGGVDFERFVVVLFGVEIMSHRARMRQRLVAAIAVFTSCGISMATAMDRGRRFLHRKLVVIWAHNPLLPNFTTVKRLGNDKIGKQLLGDNALSQIHHNGTLRKGKTIALNSAEIKIVRTVAKLHKRSLPNG